MRFRLSIVVPLAALALLGLICVHGAAPDGPLDFGARQALWCTVGIAAFALVAIAPSSLAGAAFPLYAAVNILLFAVLFIGRVGNGAQRWIDLGPFQVQPSELAKPAVVLALARLLSRRTGPWTAWQAIVPIAVVMVPAALIVQEPDLGTAITLLPVLVAVLWVAGAPVRLLGAFAVAGLLAVPPIWSYGLDDYQRGRVLAYVNPEAHSVGWGYQAIQSEIAVGSGGVIGRVWSEGTQSHLDFLPERHTDFIFAVVGEAGGFIGSVVVIALFGLLIWGILDVARATRDPFGRLAATGIAALLWTHVAVNTGVVVGLLPVTGITLPFLSYGGSSLVVSFAMVGIVLWIDRRAAPFLASA